LENSITCVPLRPRIEAGNDNTITPHTRQGTSFPYKKLRQKTVEF